MFPLFFTFKSHKISKINHLREAYPVASRIAWHSLCRAHRPEFNKHRSGLILKDYPIINLRGLTH